MEPSENKENYNFVNSKTVKKRNNPLSSLSASESEDEGSKRRKTVEDFVESKETLSLPTIKIQPILGVKPLSFPVHPRLTLIDLKDFILFTLNIPHPQQILSFSDEGDGGKVVLLSNFSENSLLCSVPGLIDEVTGRCAPVSLSFKMSSGMDFSINPSDIEYESNSNSGSSSNEYFGLGDNDEGGFFEISSEDGEQNKKLSALAASLASIIPLPPGVSKSSKMLFRSLSKSSPTNSNLPTLWEIYFPESGVKMMVTALINVSEIKSDSAEGTNGTESGDVNAVVNPEDIDTQRPKMAENCEIQQNYPVINAPALVITSEFDNIPVVSQHVTTPEPVASVTKSANEPKHNCEKCRIRCRPALRFICKCNKTFCQSHRYPDQHDCSYDHRADGLATIQANNPKIVKDKVSNF
jgi:hypothetical protein